MVNSTGATTGGLPLRVRMVELITLFIPYKGRGSAPVPALVVGKAPVEMWYCIGMMAISRL
jgi:hypothetical protein